jgi:hypothetical protein
VILNTCVRFWAVRGLERVGMHDPHPLVNADILRGSAGFIEIDAVELVPFAAITEADVRRAGESDRETLRKARPHAGPIHEHILVYRIELHAVSAED